MPGVKKEMASTVCGRLSWFQRMIDAWQGFCGMRCHRNEPGGVSIGHAPRLHDVRHLIRFRKRNWMPFSVGLLRTAGAAGLAIVIGWGAATDLRAEAVILTVTGSIDAVNNPAEYTEAQFQALSWHELRTTTVVTDGVRVFEGLLLRDLLAALGATGDMVTATARNDYSVDIPFDDFIRFDVMLARRMDGEMLSPRDKGPLWIVYPRDDHAELQDIRYDYRWVWQLTRLHVQ
jgi:hypothetical protein